MIEIGLGLRPDLTGRGIGLEFVQAGLACTKNTYSCTAFRLKVATFNQRAIRVYEKAGFHPVCVFMHTTNVLIIVCAIVYLLHKMNIAVLD